MVQLSPLLATLLTIVPFLAAHAAPAEIMNLIHAQSLSDSNGYVPMQKLGHDGLPLHRGTTPFRPIMVVPLPSSGNRAAAAAAKMDTADRANKYRNNVVGMDDQGQIKTVQLAATTWAAAPTPVAHRKNLIGMEDDGAVRTLALPMTTAVPSVAMFH